MAAKATKSAAAKKTKPASADDPAMAEAADAPAKAPKGASVKKAAKTAPVRSQQSPADGEAEVPMNRAERRAKGRGRSLAQVPAAGKVSGKPHGPAHTHRNWANRRTG